MMKTKLIIIIETKRNSRCGSLKLFCEQDPYLRIILTLDLVIGDSVELPKWLNSVSGTKKSAKTNPSCLVEGTLSIGWHWDFERSKC